MQNLIQNLLIEEINTLKNEINNLTVQLTAQKREAKDLTNLLYKYESMIAELQDRIIRNSALEATDESTIPYTDLNSPSGFSMRPPDNSEVLGSDVEGDVHSSKLVNTSQTGVNLAEPLDKINTMLDIFEKMGPQSIALGEVIPMEDPMSATKALREQIKNLNHDHPVFTRPGVGG